VRPPTSDHHELPTWPVGQGVDHLVDVDPPPLHGVGELVEHQKVVGLLGDPAFDLGPSLRGLCGVVGVVTGLARPRPPRAHLVPLDRPALAGLLVQLAKAFEDRLFPDPPLRRLDELEHPDIPALVPRAKTETERGCRFPRAVTGVHDQQRLVAPLPGAQSVLGEDRWRALRGH